MKKQVVLRLVFGFLLLGWMIFIFCLSDTKAEASDDMSLTLASFLQRLFFPKWGELSDAGLALKMKELNFLTRKTAHFLEFVLLGTLLALFFSTFSLRRITVFLCSFGAGVLSAFLDELHQLFILGRSMEVFDSFVDSAGAFFGVALAFMILYLLEEQPRKNKMIGGVSAPLESKKL